MARLPDRLSVQDTSVSVGRYEPDFAFSFTMSLVESCSIYFPRVLLSVTGLRL